MFGLSWYRCVRCRGAFNRDSVRRVERLEDRRLLSIQPILDALADPQAEGAYRVADAPSLLVRFRDAPATVPTGTAPGSQFGSEMAGAKILREYDLVPGLQKIGLGPGANLDAALAAYRDRPDVLYAEPNYMVYATAEPDDLRFSELWGLNNTGQTGGTVDADIDAPAAWDVTTGSNSVVVAVIDTGVDYTHEDLAANIWVNPGEIAGDGIDNDGNGYVDDIRGYDFANNDNDPMDDQGHGTHVAGTIGAVADNGVGVTGVNWNVQIMAVKFLAADGSGSVADAIDGITYAVDNGALISNNSWGDNGEFSQALFDAVQYAQSAGHLFVAAAGNGNSLGIGQNNDLNPFYPAGLGLDNVLSVAASDNNDNGATFSNYGVTTVDLAAPGVDILSTTRSNTYGTLSGTSMAAPHVTGVAALLYAAHPDWTYDQVIQQILSTVDPLPAFQGITVTGGRLNAASALGNPEPPPPPPPPASLPYLEDFTDGVADHFRVRAGSWDTANDRYNATPVADDDNLAAISTLPVGGGLPAEVEIQASINADEGQLIFFGTVVRDNLTNGFVVFDYQSDTDFKFAGPDMDADQWVIGHRDAVGWNIDATTPQTLDAATDYAMRLVLLSDASATLLVDDQPTVAYTFADTLTDGEVGLGMRNSSTHFDNIVVQAYVPPPVPGSLPIVDDFSDGVADFFQPRSGLWIAGNQVYGVTPFVGSDAVSTLAIADPLPADMELEATINADAVTPDRLSNAFIVFDYQGATDFKFAGAYVGVNRWLIGQRTPTGWQEDATLTETINASTDYDLRVILRGDQSATLLVGGVEKLSYPFSDPLNDGEIGLATKNAISRFDNLLVQPYTEPPSTPLPTSEDFADGVADFFEVRAGTWDVAAGGYGATPIAGGDAVSTVRVAGPLPANVEIEATIDADPATTGLLSNAMVIFDYQTPADFKFAGAYVGSNRWVIGHRNNLGWWEDASFSETISAQTAYGLRVVVENTGDVTLSVDGVPKLTKTYASLLTDGSVGVGTRNAISRFDDVRVAESIASPPPPAATLPVAEDFEDGLADSFQEQLGGWSVNAGRYHANPFPGGDAVSTLLLADPLPGDVRLEATVSADLPGGNANSNGLLIFDYQSPTDFKYAGAYAGANRWVIGRRTATGWLDDATFSETISASTDYRLELIIENSQDVTLRVDGLAKASYSYVSTVTDGEVGVGTWDAVAQYDDVVVAAYVAPPSATLPVIEDFADGVADFFDVRSGTWDVAGGIYGATPVAGGDAVSTVRVAGPLPADVEIEATIDADPATTGLLSNAMVIFDYQTPTDFKFAGAYVGSNRWLIGHRNNLGWWEDASFSETISAQTAYGLRVVVENTGDVTLSVDGVPKVTKTYASLLTDGSVGVGTRNAISRFDDVRVAEYIASPPPPVTTLPVSEDFEDGVADSFQGQLGGWTVSGGRYHANPFPGGDAVSTLLLADPLPGDVRLEATVSADLPGGNANSNGLLIFDYQSPTDFKYAGAYAGADRWVIGRRTATGWLDDATFSETIGASTNYRLELIIENSQDVTLRVDGLAKASYSYASTVTDGEVGVGTWDAVAHYDDVVVAAYVAPPSATLPVIEDFQDGVADFFEVRTGTWSVAGGVYGAAPVAGGDAVSTVRVAGPLPPDVEIEATIDADPATTGLLSNAMVIFDYQTPTDFKFAGAYVGSNRWVIGHRNNLGWWDDASFSETISAQTAYGLRVLVGSTGAVTLSVDGVSKVTKTYATLLTDGAVGVGTRNAISRFDDVRVQHLGGTTSIALTGSTFESGAGIATGANARWFVPAIGQGRADAPIGPQLSGKLLAPAVDTVLRSDVWTRRGDRLHAVDSEALSSVWRSSRAVGQRRTVERVFEHLPADWTAVPVFDASVVDVGR
ncbi:MAG: S8 family peptidase [Pirellulales bacterium]